MNGSPILRTYRGDYDEMECDMFTIKLIYAWVKSVHTSWEGGFFLPYLWRCMREDYFTKTEGHVGATEGWSPKDDMPAQDDPRLSDEALRFERELEASIADDVRALNLIEAEFAVGMRRLFGNLEVAMEEPSWVGEHTRECVMVTV